jgi:hypothetical protein
MGSSSSRRWRNGTVSDPRILEFKRAGDERGNPSINHGHFQVLVSTRFTGTNRL